MIGPVGNQRAVSRAGDRIFGHSLCGREEARDEIAIGAGSGDNGRESIDGGELLHVRSHSAHLGFRVEDTEIVASAQHHLRLCTERLEQFVIVLGFRRRAGREVERVQIRFARNNKLAAFRIKCHAPFFRFLANLHNHVRGAEGGVSAEIHLDAGSEPTDVKSTVFPNIKRGFSKVILGGDGLHRRVGEPLVERANGGGVASKKLAAESIYLVDGNVHSLISREGRGECKGGSILVILFINLDALRLRKKGGVEWKITVAAAPKDRQQYTQRTRYMPMFMGTLNSSLRLQS